MMLQWIAHCSRLMEVELEQITCGICSSFSSHRSCLWEGLNAVLYYVDLMLQKEILHVRLWRWKKMFFFIREMNLIASYTWEGRRLRPEMAFLLPKLSILGQHFLGLYPMLFYSNLSVPIFIGWSMIIMSCRQWLAAIITLMVIE